MKLQRAQPIGGKGLRRSLSDTIAICRRDGRDDLHCTTLKFICLPLVQTLRLRSQRARSLPPIQ